MSSHAAAIALADQAIRDVHSLVRRAKAFQKSIAMRDKALAKCHETIAHLHIDVAHLKKENDDLNEALKGMKRED